MERILILGSPGSGKSTFAIQLGKTLNLPVVHLDKLNWQAGWRAVEREVFIERCTAEVERERWIIDGMYLASIELRLARCDTVILLDRSRFFCLKNVIKRYFLNRGKVRPDMGEGCKEQLDSEFLTYVWNFNKNYRKKLYHFVASTEKTVYILKNNREYRQLLRTFSDQ